MTEDLFFKIVIGVLVIGFIANFIQDYLNNEYTKEQLKKLSTSYSDLWSHIYRIDSEIKEIRLVIDADNKRSKEAIESAYKELKADIMFWEKQRDETMDKFTFDNGVITNRLNSHAKKIVYVKKVLDKLFDHKVEIKHKAKLVKLEGELDKW